MAEPKWNGETCQALSLAYLAGTFDLNRPFGHERVAKETRADSFSRVLEWIEVLF